MPRLFQAVDLAPQIVAALAEGQVGEVEVLGGGVVAGLPQHVAEVVAQTHREGVVARRLRHPQTATHQSAGSPPVAPGVEDHPQGVEQHGALGRQPEAARLAQRGARRDERRLRVAVVLERPGLVRQQLDFERRVRSFGEQPQTLLEGLESGVVLPQAGVQLAGAQLQVGAPALVLGAAIALALGAELEIEAQGPGIAARRAQAVGLRGARTARGLDVVQLHGHLGGSPVERGGLGIAVGRGRLGRRLEQIGQGEGALAGAPVMVRDPIGETRLAAALASGELFGEPEMQRLSPAGLEALGDRLSQARPRRGVASSGGFGQRRREALRDQQTERAVDGVFGGLEQRRQRRQVDGLSGHGEGLEHGAGVDRQLVKALRHQLVDLRGRRGQPLQRRQRGLPLALAIAQHALGD